MNKDRILAILEYDDKTWISFIKETTDRIILDAGWPEFFKDNPLYVGMKLKFKLMNTNDIKFRVSITKVNAQTTVKFFYLLLLNNINLKITLTITYTGYEMIT